MRKVILNFHEVSCRSTFKVILGISFLEKLDAVTSLIHIKVSYHDKEGISATVSVDLVEAKRIKEPILNDILMSVAIGAGESLEDTNMFDLDA